MPAPTAQLFVFIWDHSACVKIQGRANFTSSIDFDALITRLCERGITHFLIELSECPLMDSTFLGVLAGAGLKLPHSDQDPGGAGLELLNANERVTELLENVGVLHLFKLSAHALDAAAALEACAQPSLTASRAQVTGTCLKAHQVLEALDPKNIERFKDVTKFLAEELARLQSEPPPPKA